MDAQIGWRACRRCNGLANINAPGNACLGGEVHDIDFSPEGRVWVGEMPPGVAPDLGLCSRCARLASRGGNSKCWDGAPHSFEEFSPPYGLATGVVAGAAHGW